MPAIKKNTGRKVVKGLHISFLCVLLSFAAFATGQDIPEDKLLIYEVVMLSFDTTSCPKHGIAISNDTLIAAFRQAATHYPELCLHKIKLKYGYINTSMAALPTVWSVFRHRDKRTYKVIINNNTRKAQTQLMYAAPFNARVGVMGHELAHILEYTAKSGWQLTWTGIRYLGKNYRRTMERQTDLIAIERGFGWQVYHYSYFVIYESNISDAYRRKKLDVYLNPEDILKLIN